MNKPVPKHPRPRRIPANLLPHGIGAANIGVIVLLLADFGSVGGLLNHCILSIGRDSDALHDAVGDLARNGGNFIGLLLGIELGMTGWIFPMQLLARRKPVAVKAYRILCRLILSGHVPLLLALGWDFSRRPAEAFFFLFLSAPVSLLATPLLYPIWRALQMRWLDLSAPPTEWEPMLGVDGAAVVSKAAPDRARRLHAMFRPASLAPPPRFQAIGLLALPLLFVLDALALATGVGITSADSLQNLGQFIESRGIALLVIVPFVLMPAQMVMPSGSRFGRLLHRSLGGAIVLVHLGATACFLAVNLHLQAHRPPVQVAAEPMLLALTLALVATLPLAMVLALSLGSRSVDSTET